jgi:hypothetical protein
MTDQTQAQMQTQPQPEAEPTTSIAWGLVMVSLVVLVVLVLIALNFAFLRHWVGLHVGAQSTLTGPWYNFWSGFGSDLGEATLITAVIAAMTAGFRKSNCHVKGCWRLGHFPLEHTPFHLCHRHHPAVAGTALTHAAILDHHRRHREDYEARHPRNVVGTSDGTGEPARI